MQRWSNPLHYCCTEGVGGRSRQRKAATRRRKTTGGVPVTEAKIGGNSPKRSDRHSDVLSFMKNDVKSANARMLSTYEVLLVLRPHAPKMLVQRGRQAFSLALFPNFHLLFLQKPHFCTTTPPTAISPW